MLVICYTVRVVHLSTQYQHIYTHYSICGASHNSIITLERFGAIVSEKKGH